MRHIIGILLQNESGALSRVAGLFSSRGYNIESLSVAATDDPSLSRITLVTKGSDAVVAQIANQLNRLIDVIEGEVAALVSPVHKFLYQLVTLIRYSMYWLHTAVFGSFWHQ